MEEVRQKPEYFVAVHFLTKLMDIYIFLQQSDDQTEVSKPATLQTVKEDPEVLTGESDTLDRPLTSLEKLHYIVGYAIVRPDLRLQKFEMA